ncbi:acyltransferase family protein [Azohydromonas australica]|uniref:acyltransferase family protein n=1 Tax=Azohydromonas australica TaxID=364039 RepID=UPI0004028AB6|nr:acyltransferase [Azohydromonas australica]
MKNKNLPTGDISVRIDLLRYVLILGVVLLHSLPYAAITELPPDPTAFEWTKSFIQNILFRMSVPILGCISGYLLFRPKGRSYAEILGQRSRTIFVPMLFWNAFAFALLYLSALGTGTASEVYPLQAWRTLDGLLGVTRAPWDYPLNFLRDLMLLVVMTPVLRFLLERASYAGFALWSAFFFFDLDGHLMTRPDLPVTYALGALAAVRQWDLRALDRFAGLCLALLVGVCIVMMVNRVADRKWFTVFAPFLIWSASSLPARFTLVRQWTPRLAVVSFFIYVFHAFPLKAIAMALNEVPLLPRELTWFLAPALTIMACHVLFHLLSRICPHGLGLVTGGRISARKPEPRAPKGVPA